MNDLTIDINFIGQLSSRLEQFTSVRKNVWVARCPICGDSKKSKFKKRFYIYFDPSSSNYCTKCHNCSEGTYIFPHFLKIHHPDLYKEYMVEKLPNKSTLKKDRFTHVKQVSIPKKVVCKGFDYSFLKRFDELPENHPARIYVEYRKIPIDRVFYADHFCDVIDTLDLDIYKMSYTHAKEPRMIIPFYREDGLSTVFQARAFSKKEALRYITIKEDEGESKVYGLNTIDKEQPVWCVEGPIDSMMIPNCIAMSGISTRLPRGVSEFRFVYDNEPRNADIVKSMRKRLRSDHKVVIFPERVTFNDINDMIVKGEMSIDKILDILEQNLYSKDLGILKLREWSKL